MKGVFPEHCPIGKHPSRVPSFPPTKKGKCYEHRNIKAIAICKGKPVCLNCWTRIGFESSKGDSGRW